MARASCARAWEGEFGRGGGVAHKAGGAGQGGSIVKTGGPAREGASLFERGGRRGTMRSPRTAAGPGASAPPATCSCLRGVAGRHSSRRTQMRRDATLRTLAVRADTYTPPAAGAGFVSCGGSGVFRRAPGARARKRVATGWPSSGRRSSRPSRRTPAEDSGSTAGDERLRSLWAAQAHGAGREEGAQDRLARRRTSRGLHRIPLRACACVRVWSTRACGNRACDTAPASCVQRGCTQGARSAVRMR